MQVQIDLWQLILALAALIAAFATVVWIFGAALVRQFEKRLSERFAAIEQARRDAGTLLQNDLSALKNMERDFLQFQIDAPMRFVMRDDYIRGQTVIESKLDALYSKLELVQIQGAKRD